MKIWKSIVAKAKGPKGSCFSSDWGANCYLGMVDGKKYWIFDMYERNEHPKLIIEGYRPYIHHPEGRLMMPYEEGDL